jgi:restriction endonuclease Mrr
MAPLADSDVGIFVSTGGFTRDADEEARRQEKRRIVLVDLKQARLICGQNITNTSLNFNVSFRCNPSTLFGS